MARANGENCLSPPASTKSDRKAVFPFCTGRRQTKAEAPFVSFESHPTSHTGELSAATVPKHQGVFYTPAVGKEMTFSIIRAPKSSPLNKPYSTKLIIKQNLS